MKEYKIVTVIRQGDVNLLPIDSIPKGAGEVKPVEGVGTVLAYGEVTGHAHVMPAVTSKQYKVGDKNFLKVTKKSPLRHGDLHTGANPDHHTITIPSGQYEIRIAQEETPVGIRKVVD